MTETEIKEVLQYYEKESKMYIHNEIFTDMSTLNEKSSGHVAFVYSYYYLVSWLYRHTKYGLYPIDVKMIKKILGYSENTKEIDYLIKKGGEIENMNLISTTNNYPILTTFENETIGFEYVDELDEVIKKYYKLRHTNRFTIKRPIKAFHRTSESLDDNCNDGTYFDISNTHEIPFDVFIFCTSNKEINVTGFYIWSYLKMMNQMFSEGFDVSLSNLSKNTHIPIRTLCKYLDVLKQYNMIATLHNQEYFSPSMKKEDRKSNTYITNKFDQFTIEKKSYTKLLFKNSKVDLDEYDFDNLFT